MVSRYAMKRWNTLSNMYNQHINEVAPHASALRRLGLKNWATKASHSSTGGSSPDSDELLHATPPSSSSDIVITDSPCGESPCAPGISSSSLSSTNEASDSNHEVACGKGSPLCPPSPWRLNLARPVGSIVVA